MVVNVKSVLYCLTVRFPLTIKSLSMYTFAPNDASDPIYNREFAEMSEKTFNILYLSVVLEEGTEPYM